MERLSSSSVVSSAVARPCCILHPCLVSKRNVGFPSAWNERSASKSVSWAFSSHSSRVLPINATTTEVDVSKVVPQADRVLIKLEELSEQSTGGVLLPKSAVKFEHYLCGEVLSVGKTAAGVSIGQKVLFSDINAYEVNFGTKEKLCFCKAGDLLALVE